MVPKYHWTLTPRHRLSDSVSPGRAGGGPHLGNPRTKSTVQSLLLSELSGSVALNLSLSPNGGRLVAGNWTVDCLRWVIPETRQNARRSLLSQHRLSVCHLRNHPSLFHHPSLPRHTPTSVYPTGGFAGEFLGLEGRQNSQEVGSGRLLGQGL